MIGSLTAVFSKYNANIIEMVNKSKGDYAYNIIDIAGTEVNEEKIAEIKSIEGIIKVRLVD